jgi:hypothetical protein
MAAQERAATGVSMGGSRCRDANEWSRNGGKQPLSPVFSERVGPMKALTKSLPLCLAVALVLFAGSTALAGWQYVAPVTSTETIVEYAPGSVYSYYSYSPVITYRAPMVPVPVIAPRPRVIYPAPIYRRPFVRPVRVFWP